MNLYFVFRGYCAHGNTVRASFAFLFVGASCLSKPFIEGWIARIGYRLWARLPFVCLEAIGGLLSHGSFLGLRDIAVISFTKLLMASDDGDDAYWVSLRYH